MSAGLLRAARVVRVDLRLVVPAAACWLVAGVLVGLPRETLDDASLAAAAGLLGLSVLLVIVLLITGSKHRRRNGRDAPGIRVFAPPGVQPRWGGRLLGRGQPRREAPRRGQPRRDAMRFGQPGRGALRLGQPRFVQVQVDSSRPVRPTRERGRRRAAAVLGVAAMTCAAAGLVATGLAAQLPERQPTAVAPLMAHTLTVQLTVGTASVQTAGSGFAPAAAGIRFTATASSVRSGDFSVAAQMPVLVFLTPDVHAAPLEIGDELEVRGHLKPADPGGSVVYLLFADGPPVLLHQAPWYLAWADHLRSSFRESAVGLPGDGARLLPGLAIGDVSLVDDDLNQQMITSGLSHLTAVSGANCAIVVAGIMLLGGLLRLSRRRRIALSLAVMLGFVVLVTPSSSVLRAAVMATIVLVSLASGRAPKGLPALALATIILLACDPWLARNVGLMLSVLATGGLLVLTKPLQQVLSKRIPSWLALVIAVPLAAQIACQPVLVLLSPTISTYSVVANLLAEPAAPVATVIGLVSCVVGAALPILAPAGAWLTWVPASWIAGVAHFFATAPGASLPWVGGPVGVVLVLVLTAATLVLLLLRPTLTSLRPQPIPRRNPPGIARHSRPARPDSRTIARLVAAGVLLLATAGYLGTTVGPAVLAGNAWPDNWQIAACDIGQGDAVVVRSHRDAGAAPAPEPAAEPDDRAPEPAAKPDDRAPEPAAEPDVYALVDVGPDPALLTTCLDRLGITTIDLLVLTHYDLDHVGGLSAVVGRVGTVLMGPPQDAHDERMGETLRAGGADVRQARRGDTGALGDIGWNILWPEEGTTLRGNDACVTVQFVGAFRSLFLGDLGEDAQRQVAHANTLTDEDVVKVAHHGSADQSEALYQAITAEVGLVSVGADNRYGHPTDRLLGILARAGTAAYRTDRLGMIVLAPSAEGIVVWSEGQARVGGKKK